MVVDYEFRGGVAYIHMNRPQRLNAVVPELVEGIIDGLLRANHDKALAVVLAGRGRAFCAGHDLRHDVTDVDEVETLLRLQRIQDITRLVRALPCPVIASVHGYALGAGCEFALCSDFVVAASSATFGFPEVSVGLTVTGGISHILPLAVGPLKAKELLLLGEYFGAEQALAWHLVNRVVPDHELVSATDALVTTLISKPRLSSSFAKFGVDRGSDGDMESALEREVLFTQMAMASAASSRASQEFQQKAVQPNGIGE